MFVCIYNVFMINHLGSLGLNGEINRWAFLPKRLTNCSTALASSLPPVLADNSTAAKQTHEIYCPALCSKEASRHAKNERQPDVPPLPVGAAPVFSNSKARIN